MATEEADVPVIKNLYSEPWKQQYGDLRLSTKQSETCGLAASVDLIAAPWDVGGGGVLGVLKLGDVTRNPPVAKIKGHTSTIQDTNFNPFHSHVLATACEDTLVRVWEISEEISGSTEIKEPIATLSGASKKVLSAEWNPMASGILASAAFDGSVFLWDVTRAQLINTMKLGDAVLSLKWSWAGQQVACTTKDKLVQISCTYAASVESLEMIIFTKKNEPRLAVNQLRAEIGRMLKQENNNVLLPVSFIVPRKNQDVFQPDLYPPAPDCVPTLTAHDWLSGQKKPIRRVTVTPETKRPKPDVRFAADTADIARNNATAAPLSKQEDLPRAAKAHARTEVTSDGALKERIDELERALADEKTTTEQLQAQVRDLETRFIAAKKAEKTAIERAEAAEKLASSGAAHDVKRSSAAPSALGGATSAALEKKVKDLETKLSSKSAAVKRLEAQVKELEEANASMKIQMQQAKGTLQRAATLAGLDKDMKQELNEMRDFFRDILEHVGEET